MIVPTSAPSVERYGMLGIFLGVTQQTVLNGLVMRRETKNAIRVYILEPTVVRQKLQPSQDFKIILIFGGVAIPMPCFVTSLASERYIFSEGEVCLLVKLSLNK